MNDLVFLKLGGSLITDKRIPHTARIEVLDRISEEIREARQQLPDLKILLGHGSGSFGHMAASQYGTRDGVKTAEEWQGFAAVWQEARALNDLVMASLARAGLPVIALSPSAQVLTRAHTIIEWNTAQISASIERGLLPVIFGDVVFDEEIGGTILSTEEEFEYLAERLSPSRILLAGIEKGIWKDFPQRSEIFERITPANWHDLSAHLLASENPDVTGGMRSKVASMLNLVKAVHCREVCIFSGLEKRSILEVLTGKCTGTIINLE